MSLPIAIGLGVSRARSLLGCVASSLVTCGAPLVHVMLLVFAAGVAALHGLWAGTLDATVFVLVVTTQSSSPPRSSSTVSAARA
ncbi:hypothetical protein I3I95_03460 [bacterium]|nr:hypothetical protein [bacterium]